LGRRKEAADEETNQDPDLVPHGDLPIVVEVRRLYAVRNHRRIEEFIAAYHQAVRERQLPIDIDVAVKKRLLGRDRDGGEEEGKGDGLR
jgi:hypothetical protein